jgi:S-adenosylmethionine decarboxylase
MKYRHLVGVIEGVWVSRTDHLRTIMQRIAERNGFTVVSSAFHQFEPHGATGVLVLAESHFSAHTYPEENKIYIDVFCCSENFDPELCSTIIEVEFAALRGTWAVVER